MEMKLPQDLSRVYHNPLLLVFLDLNKAYDTVYRGRLIRTLEGYSMRPCLCKLLATFWVYQKYVSRQNGNCGTTFQATWVTTQGFLVSPTLFNVVIDNVIHTWLVLTMEDQQVTLDGLGENTHHCLGFFCDGDVMVGSRDSDWLQHLMNVLIRLFRQYGLAANVDKKLQPSVIRLGMSEDSRVRNYMGVIAL